MKLKLAIAVAALQVGVLVFMAGQREWISRFGEQLTLRTAPIDPNDPMRGAYVSLSYEIGFAPAALCKGLPAEWAKANDYKLYRRIRDRVVYASLRVGEGGVAELVSLSDEKPAQGPMLKGRVVSVSEAGVQVRYGVEALFLQQEAARQLEEDRWHKRPGAPMDVVVAASASGVGVLKSYSWEPLGITLEFDRAPRPTGENQTPPAEQPGIDSVTVVLHNYGDNDLAIVDLPGDHSFRLVSNTRWGPSNYHWTGEGRMVKIAPPTEDDIVVLKPGAEHRRRIDLTDSYWWIINTSKAEQTPFSIRDVPATDRWSASFRIEYLPPGADALAGLPNGELVRHGSLRSRAFNASRNVD